MQDSIDIHLKEQGIPFGKYRLIAKLAIGGMAELFVAKQKGMGGFSKKVAVKCILPYFARDREFIAMFLDEARLAAHLNHPNIVQIYDIGDVDGVYYMTMEYIPGQNLKAFAKRLYADENYREFPPFAIIASLIAQALQGLEHVHQAKGDNLEELQLVHRDISPNNLMLSYDGNVKVVDFGVAKAKTQERETAVGVLKGRLSYMSPEHLSGQSLDGRSDLFAMAVVLYELTTNRRLFKRKTEAETMQALMTAPIPLPSRFYEHYPSGLEELLMKALQRDPDKRFQTAGDMRDALEHWLASLDNPMVGTRPVVALVEELFAEEKTQEAQGNYAKPVTQNDLLNLARGSYRVMPDGSIYSYFAAPGTSGPPTGGHPPHPPGGHPPHVPPHSYPHGPPQHGPPQHGPPQHTSPQHTPPQHTPPPLQRGVRSTSPYATSDGASEHWGDFAHTAEADLLNVDEEPTNVSASQSDLAESEGGTSPSAEIPKEEQTTPSEVSEDTQEKTPNVSEEAKERGARPLETASYSVASVAGLSATSLEDLQPTKPHRSGQTKPMGSLPSMIEEVMLDQEDGDGLVTEPGLKPALEEDDHEPPTTLQKVPPGSDDALISVSVSVISDSLESDVDGILSPPNQGKTAQSRPAFSERSAEVIEKPGGKGTKIAFLLLFLLLIGGGGWWWSQQQGNQEGTDQQLSGSVNQEGSDIDQLDAGELSPDAGSSGVVDGGSSETLSDRVMTTKQVHPAWRMAVRKVPIRRTRPRRRRRTRPRRRRRTRPPRRRRTRPRRRRRTRPPRRRRTRPSRRRVHSSGPLRSKKPFSSVKLPKKIRLRVYDYQGGRRVYTKEHARLCRKIEREVGRLFGNKRAVRGITRAWQRYVKKRFARSRRKRYVFYPRAAAYVIHRDLKRGKSRGYASSNLVKYQKTYRFRKYRNK